MKKFLLVLFILTSIIYSGFAAVYVEYVQSDPSEMVLKPVVYSRNNYMGIHMGYFRISCDSNDEIYFTFASPSTSSITAIKGDQSITFKMVGYWHIESNTKSATEYDFSSNNSISHAVKDNKNVNILDIYLLSDKTAREVNGAYALENQAQLQNMIVQSIHTDKHELSVNGTFVTNNNTQNDTTPNVSVPICPISPTVSDQNGSSIPGFTTDKNNIVVPVQITPVISNTFVDFYNQEINESSYALDYNYLRNNYSNAPIVQAKISVSNSNGSTTETSFDDKFTISISSTGSFSNNYNSIPYKMNIGSITNKNNMSVAYKYSDSLSYSYSISDIKTGSYCYFPIYYQFGSEDKLRNALAGTYIDTITVTITEEL